MDFSSKQALAVVVVIAVAAIVVGAAIIMTKANNKSAKASNDKVWGQTDKLVDSNFNDVAKDQTTGNPGDK